MDFSELIFDYVAIILEFVLEFGIFYGLHTARLNRREHYIKRVVIATIVILVACLGVAYLYTLIGNTVGGRIFIYAVLFIFFVAAGFYLYNESGWTIIFCACSSYAVQNTVYKIYLFQYFFSQVLGIYNFGGIWGPFLFRLMYYSVFALLAYLFYRFYIKKVREKLAVDKLNEKVFLVASIILLATIIICSFNDLFFERAGISVDSGVELSLLFGLRQMENALSAICGITLLLVLSKTIEQADLQRELEQMRLVIGQSEQQYKFSKETMDTINIKCHDMKYKLDAAINGNNLNEQDFADLRKAIQIYDCNIETGNKILNVLFFDKSLYCENHDIKLTCMIDGARLNFMSDGDLYCLFGNLIDNALEAVTKLTDRDKRVISVVVRMQGNMVLVEAENYFNGNLKEKDGVILTIKDDKNYHGFGLMSMRTIASKYDGILNVTVEDDVFHLTMLFPTIS